MSIKGVAVVLAPDDPVWRGEDHSTVITDEDGSEEQAKQILMNRFAKTVIGNVFPLIDDTDAWNLWQIAEKNGFQIKMFYSLPVDLTPPMKRLVDTV